MSERVLGHLAAADRRRQRRRAGRAALWGMPVLALCLLEAAILRWPHLALAAAERIAHATGTMLVVLAALRRVRDGLFAPAEMAATAAVVTMLVLVLVAVGLGCVLWGGDATPPEKTTWGDDTEAVP